MSEEIIYLFIPILIVLIILIILNKIIVDHYDKFIEQEPRKAYPALG